MITFACTNIWGRQQACVRVTGRDLITGRKAIREICFNTYEEYYRLAGAAKEEIKAELERDSPAVAAWKEKDSQCV